MEPDNSYSFVSVKQISSNLDWKVGEFRLHIYLVRGYFSFGRQVFRGEKRQWHDILPRKNSYFTIRKWKNFIFNIERDEVQSELNVISFLLWWISNIFLSRHLLSSLSWVVSW